MKKLICILLCLILLISCKKAESSNGIETPFAVDNLWLFKINHIYETEVRNPLSDKYAEYAFTVDYEYNNIGYGLDEEKLIFDSNNIEFYDSDHNPVYAYNLYNLSDYYYRPEAIAKGESHIAHITFCLKEKKEKVFMKITQEDNNKEKKEFIYILNLEYN